MTEALCYLEIEMENTSLIDLLPSLEIVAKLNGLRLNRTKDFRLAKRLLIMNIYLNVKRLCDVWLMRKHYSATYCKTRVI